MLIITFSYNILTFTPKKKLTLEVINRLSDTKYIFPHITFSELLSNITFNKIGVYDDMITTEDVLNMNFYKKEKFTGSYQGMRYLLKKDTEDETAVFRCYIWKGPYNFISTPEEEKQMKTFDFTEEGKQKAVDWMNEQWKSRDSWL